MSGPDCSRRRRLLQRQTIEQVSCQTSRSSADFKDSGGCTEIVIEAECHLLRPADTARPALKLRAILAPLVDSDRNETTVHNDLCLRVLWRSARFYASRSPRIAASWGAADVR